MSRCLTILEISQKQSYIFASKKLQDNIVNSAVIAYVLGAEYIGEILQGTGYQEDKNLVYSGGGHTILEFPDKDTAKEMVSIITKRAYIDFDGLTLFAKTEEFSEDMKMEQCLKNLTKALERKKSVRLSSFHQGSYGVENIDSNTLNVVARGDISAIKKRVKEVEDSSAAKEFTPDGYSPLYQFNEIGGTKNDSNFIAVIHIDGNGMGKRVEELYKLIGEQSWDDTKKSLRAFSEGIDKDFKEAYKDMTNVVAYNLKESGLDKKLSLNQNKFPVRRIITAGDDICFVTEGRIGIECARVFMEKLAKKQNVIDKKNYSACAGVAIVHQKYPFHRAYELAEILCNNAKKYGAQISPDDNGRSISAIDWHIEFGELKDSLEEIRRSYITLDNNRLDMRPYIVLASDDIMSDKQYIAKRYDNFKRIVKCVQNNGETYGNGKVKELRAALKQGETATRNYLVFNQMKDIIVENRPKEDKITKEDLMELFSGYSEEGMSFILQSDGRKHSILYDSIELMDTYIALEGGE